MLVKLWCKTIGKPLGAYCCGLISVAKLPADLLVRPPACLPNWKISGKVDGQHAGKLDIPTTKPAKSDNFGQHLQ